jgi:hypothetical protein
MVPIYDGWTNFRWCPLPSGDRHSEHASRSTAPACADGQGAGRRRGGVTALGPLRRRRRSRACLPSNRDDDLPKLAVGLEVAMNLDNLLEREDLVDDRL